MADQIQTIQEQVLKARSNGQKLNIVGGGSKSFMGRQSDADASILSLAELGIDKFLKRILKETEAF